MLSVRRYSYIWTPGGLHGKIGLETSRFPKFLKMNFTKTRTLPTQSKPYHIWKHTQYFNPVMIDGSTDSSTSSQARFRMGLTSIRKLIHIRKFFYFPITTKSEICPTRLFSLSQRISLKKILIGLGKIRILMESLWFPYSKKNVIWEDWEWLTELSSLKEQMILSLNPTSW